MKFIHSKSFHTAGKALLAAFGMAVLTACGGGGGGGSDGASEPVASSLSFPVRSAYAARVAAGSNDNFTLSGTCAGTATIVLSRPVAASFEGVPGYSQESSTTINTSNCTPASSGASATNYYDANYMPTGAVISNVQYARFAAPPVQVPATARVGDSGDIVTFTLYSNATKSTVTGRRVLSYSVGADTAATSLLTLTTRSYDEQNRLLATERSVYRLAGDGALALLSIDVQYSTTSNTRLLFTKV